MSKFIVIEGLDGAGTTTQSHMLSERFEAEGQECVLTAEPTDGPIGVMIRQMLSMRIAAPINGEFEPINRESLALLFAADRLDHNHVKIDPALAAGKNIVSDRYYHSSLAYQGDIDGDDRFDLDWVWTLNSRARTPDITIFLKADPEICLERLGRRDQRDIYESRDKLIRLARRYDQVMAELHSRGQPIVILDASASIEDLHSDIWEHVQ